VDCRWNNYSYRLRKHYRGLCQTAIVMLRFSQHIKGTTYTKHCWKAETYPVTVLVPCPARDSLVRNVCCLSRNARTTSQSTPSSATKFTLSLPEAGIRHRLSGPERRKTGRHGWTPQSDVNAKQESATPFHLQLICRELFQR
jgi:hypothetical protein